MDPSTEISVLASAWEAFQIVMDPMRLLILSGATLAGLMIGLIPGIGGLAGITLLLPFTYSLDPYSAFAVLLAMLAVQNTSDTIPAVLFGVPGSAGQATFMDGLPMSKKGEAGRALSAAYMSSLLGGLLGAFLMAFSIPLLRPVMMMMGTPEMAGFAILGLSVVAAISGNAPMRGLAIAAVGVMISVIGSDPRTGAFRWTFGNIYLWDGLPLVVVAMGLFALPELCDLAIGRTSITDSVKHGLKGGMLAGAKDAFRNWWLILRCSWIGSLIGAMPGVSPSVVDWIAYGHARNSLKGAKDTFGKGDVRGVIAPEAANNATSGGSLLVTVAFGIPASTAMAILLGSFINHGLQPGPDMLTKNLTLTYSMVWSIALANVIGAGLCYMFSGQFAKVALLRYSLILPAVLSVIYVGAFAASSSWGDLIALLAFGVIGWIMKRLKWPRPPLLMGVVLGAIVERYLFISIQLEGWRWLTHPVVLLFLVVALYGVASPVLQARKEAKFRRAERAEQGIAEPPPAKLNLRPVFHPVDLFPLALLLGVAFMFQQTLSWTSSSALVPRIVCIVAVVAIAINMIQTMLMRRAALDGRPVSVEGLYMDGGPDTDHVPFRTAMIRAGTFFLWVVGFILCMAVIGLIPTVPLFIIAYMRLEAKEPWRLVLIYALAMTVFQYLVFDQMLSLAWPQTLLGTMFPEFRQFVPSL